MMLTEVQAVTVHGETLSLPLEDPSGGFIVKDIEGLGPVKATIVSSPFAQTDGTQYQNSRRENRNLVLKLGLEPDYVDTSVQSLRSVLYSYFMPKSEVGLRFFLDGVHFVDITGRVESCEPSIFAKEPSVDVSIICFKPDFIAPSSVTVNGSTVADTTELGVMYPGTVETGFIFRLLVDRPITGFMLYNTPPGREFQQLEFVNALSAGDVLEISTVVGSKYARVNRAGVETPILYGVSPDSTWVNLQPGQNNLRVLTEGAPIPYTIEYVAKYGGL